MFIAHIFHEEFIKMLFSREPYECLSAIIACISTKLISSTDKYFVRFSANVGYIMWLIIMVQLNCGPLNSVLNSSIKIKHFSHHKIFIHFQNNLFNRKAMIIIVKCSFIDLLISSFQITQNLHKLAHSKKGMRNRSKMLFVLGLNGRHTSKQRVLLCYRNRTTHTKGDKPEMQLSSFHQITQYVSE